MSSTEFAWRRRMTLRDPHQTHRASTPLELFVDLCFVVAVAQVAAALHHALAEGHIAHAVGTYPMVFFAIWWAWMNFSWFASSYDNDDPAYRAAVLVQIAGVLVLAAGVPRAFDTHDFAILTVGYTIMRVGLVANWLRASRLPGQRTVARRYAGGLVVCQLGWLALLALPNTVRAVGFFVMVAADVLTPLFAERAEPTSWHPGHIADRYGGFTIIVLGEGILAATIAVQEGLDSGRPLSSLVPVAVGALLIVFNVWWLYFDHDGEAVLGRARDSESPSVLRRTAFLWGYGHFVIFSSVAAIGAGLSVSIDHALSHGVAEDRTEIHLALGSTGVGLAITVPVAVYIVSMWVLHGTTSHKHGLAAVALPITAVLVLLATFTGQAALVTGLLLSALTVLAVVRGWSQAGATAE